MITWNEALQIAKNRLAESNPAFEGDSWVLLESFTLEKDWGWVFFWTSRLWHETKDVRYAIAGNGPFIVERKAGRVFCLGTSHQVEHYIELYEKYGDPHFRFEPVSKIRLVSCTQNAKRETAMKLLRDHCGVGLMIAKRIVEDCFAGQKPCVSTISPNDAERLVMQLEPLGFISQRFGKDNQGNMIWL